MNQHSQHVHFITGRLAERAVRKIVSQVADEFQFEYSISVLPITVAALMTPKWLLRHVQIPDDADRVILPGHLLDGLDTIRCSLGDRVECGPRDIRDLPTFFGGKRLRDAGYGAHSIEIIAEINHVGRLTAEEILRLAQAYVRDGADIIDLGCTPGYRWNDVADVVKLLSDHQVSVSIDSFDNWEVSRACAAGAQLVLSVNSSNRSAALDWDTPVVLIPDMPGEEKNFDQNLLFLIDNGLSVRLDPILEPIGCGFTQSLLRYAKCRRDYPDAQIMMGIGNITELTDSDSAGINTLLIGICQELGIQSILTTQVINWARSSVRECDLARQLMHFAVAQRIPPKHLEPLLVLLRDAKVKEFSRDVLSDLAANIRDNNVRLANCEGAIHAMSAQVHVQDRDPFLVMEQLLASPIGDSINAEHAFYLGFEMAKAMTANLLSKHYEQDQPLDWGFLTQPESHHRLERRRKQK